MADKTKKKKKKKDERSTLQKIGGHTLLPYMLEAAGYSKAATKTGYPRHIQENREAREGFSRGGQVQGTKFKGTF